MDKIDLDKLSRSELWELWEEIERRLKGGDFTPESEPWGKGWLQKYPNRKTLADGTVKVYPYWAYHWVEGGKRRSEHIGSDEKLRKWKENNPPV